MVNGRRFQPTVPLRREAAAATIAGINPLGNCLLPCSSAIHRRDRESEEPLSEVNPFVTCPGGGDGGVGAFARPALSAS